MFRIIILFLLLSCSQNKTSLREKQFEEVGDSLLKYKEFIQVITPEMKDYLELEYEQYKSKYDLADAEMGRIAIVMTETYQLANSLCLIKNNLLKLKKLDEQMVEHRANPKMDSTFNWK